LIRFICKDGFDSRLCTNEINDQVGTRSVWRSHLEYSYSTMVNAPYFSALLKCKCVVSGLPNYW
jgi:hypothetical protein